VLDFPVPGDVCNFSVLKIAEERQRMRTCARRGRFKDADRTIFLAC
jgi:hypothetical protein